MEITQYDEYIPEKGLDTSFKIPRKRTAEDSFGSQAADAYAEYYAQASKAVQDAQAIQYGQYATEQAQAAYTQAQVAAVYAQYATLSGAASQASAYTNSKPPVQYPIAPPIKIETNKPPPLPPDYQATTLSSTNIIRDNPQTPTNVNAATPAYSTPVTISPLLSKPPPPQTPNAYPNASLGNNLNDQKNEAKTNWGGGATNRNWGGSGSESFTNTNSGNNSNNNRNWGSSTNPRNWNNSGGNNYFNKDSNSSRGGGGNRNWVGGGTMSQSWNQGGANSPNQEPSIPPVGGNRGWGGNANRNWSADNSNKNWNQGAGDRWRNEDGSDYDSVFDNTKFSGGRGRFGGRGGWNNRFDSSFGDEQELGDSYGGPDDYGIGVGHGNRHGWEPPGYDNDSGFNSNRGRGFSGRSRGGEGRGIHRRGNFRGGPGRFGGDFSNRERNDETSSRPFQKKEKGKTKVDTPPVVIEDLSDDSLPKEMREMFEPLICRLCMLDMSSNVMAKVHYKSKNHEKKIRKYLIEHADKTGEPLHPRALATANSVKKEKEADTDPKYFHCNVCDLPLTGKLHAESHYMGKNHNAVVMGKKQPSGKGHYDETGKWVRKLTETKIILGEGEDNFGLAFRKKPEDSVETSEVDAPKDDKPTPGNFTCSICNVSCTCQEQITAHFNGAKHKKKLKRLGVSLENFEVPKEIEAGQDDKVIVDAAAILDPNEEMSTERNDFSKYKTPSGYYYCGKCNLTLNSEAQLKQHLISKNHLRKSAKKIEQEVEKKAE